MKSLIPLQFFLTLSAIAAAKPFMVTAPSTSTPSHTREASILKEASKTLFLSPPPPREAYNLDRSNRNFTLQVVLGDDQLELDIPVPEKIISTLWELMMQANAQPSLSSLDCSPWRSSLIHRREDSATEVCRPSSPYFIDALSMSRRRPHKTALPLCLLRERFSSSLHLDLKHLIFMQTT